MNDFLLQTPQLNSTSTPFTGSFALSSEIVSQDALLIFVFTIVCGIIIGMLFAIFKLATGWIWKQ